MVAKKRLKLNHSMESDEPSANSATVVAQLKDEHRMPLVDVSDEGSFKLTKDGYTLATLYGASEFGSFTAYTHMVVTEEGRRRQLSSMQVGSCVHTPDSKIEGGARKQLPARCGVMFRVLIGRTRAGVKKTAEDQLRLMYLCFSETASRFKDVARKKCSSAEFYYCDLYAAANTELTPSAEIVPLTISADKKSSDFTWVYASLSHNYRPDAR